MNQCPFCSNLLQSHDKDKDYTRMFSHYDCDICQAEFIVDEDSQRLVTYSLEHDDYRLQINLWAETCEIQKAHHYSLKLNKGPVYHSSWYTVLSLSSVPGNVTPRNVGSKIKTFLLFS